MAAAMVSGGAALLLQSTPNLTPRHVKVALQVTADSCPKRDLSRPAPAASISMRRASLRPATRLLGILSSLLIGGQPVTGSGFAVPATGREAGSIVAGGSARVFGLIDSRKPGWSSRYSSTTPSQIIWGDINMWTADQQIIWGDQIFNPAGQQIIWGDQIYNPTGQQIIWGDQVYNPSGQQIIWGDSDTATRTRSSGATVTRRDRNDTPRAPAVSPRSTSTWLGHHRWGDRRRGVRPRRCRRLRMRGVAAVRRARARRGPLPAADAGQQRVVLDVRHVLHASALLFGPAPATVTVAIDSMAMAYGRGSRCSACMFNGGAPAIAFWVGA